MTVNRFNWDKWDTVVTECDNTKQGDVYRTDNTYACASEIPSISSSSSGCPITPTISAGLSGCQLLMPPRINDFNIIQTTLVDFFIYGEGI